MMVFLISERRTITLAVAVYVYNERKLGAFTREALSTVAKLKNLTL